MFIIGLHQLYTGRWRKSIGKGFNKILSTLIFAMCFTWQSGNVCSKSRVRPLAEPVFLLLFSSFFFLFSLTFSLLFSYCSFVLFLNIAKFFLKFINFLPCCLISLSTSCCSPSRGPAVHIFLAANTM